MVESNEEVFGVGGYLGSRCMLALLTNADLKPDIISTHNPLSSFHTLDYLQQSPLPEVTLSILIPFGARFANTFPCVVPRVEIKAMYEIIVSHAPEQGICTLNCTIPASPPQCLTVTEGVSLLLFSIIILLIKM